MTRPKILLVEDDDGVASMLLTCLEAEGFSAVHVSDGRLALDAARRESVDLVLLDLVLPHRSGLDICRDLRADPALAALPIIMLTGQPDDVDRIVGLEVGADDYITKPFQLRELMLRIKAVLRRVESRKESGVVHVGTLTVDQSQRRAFLDHVPLALTAMEFDLLCALVAARGRALARDLLLREVWGYRATDVRTRTVDVHVLQLRRKLGPESWRIETVDRFGYRLNVNPRPA